jgi:iodotyrosine deiodinase
MGSLQMKFPLQVEKPSLRTGRDREKDVMSTAQKVELVGYQEYPISEMEQRSAAFYARMCRRRSVRDFSERPVPAFIIEQCLRSAATAPSGANQQPWHFVVVGDPAVKRQIREAAEAEEEAFYQHRASEEWLAALAPLDTNPAKPFLEIAPYLIVVFAQSYSLDAQGHKIRHYYVKESVGIATGMLITAIHLSGLVCLTHTPSPMGFLNQILGRPDHERPFLILVVGFPAQNAQVPAITKKSLAEVSTFL